MVVKFRKLTEDAVIPKYMTPGSVGLDLTAVEFAFIRNGQIRLLSTGLAVELPEGTEGQIRPRSSLASKYGLTVVNSPGTIDTDYRGEIKVAVINLGSEPFVVRPGERIAQLVIVPVIKPEIEVVDDLSSTERGEGGFGSTGK